MKNLTNIMWIVIIFALLLFVLTCAKASEPQVVMTVPNSIISGESVDANIVFTNTNTVAVVPFTYVVTVSYTVGLNPTVVTRDTTTIVPTTIAHPINFGNMGYLFLKT